MSVERAITDIATGRAVVVLDDADRENEADIVFAARAATPELLAFTIRWTCGVICAPLTGADCDRLDLPPMYHANQDRKGTAFTVSVDARDGITTGISAAERAHTLRLLADPGTGPGELARPGHVFPLRAHPDGVLGRRGHTEAAVDLVRLAGAGTAGVVSELVNDDGTMVRGDDAAAFARRHGLTLISVADLIAYRSERVIDLRPPERTSAPAVERVAEARVPTRYGVFRAVGYRAADGRDHVALVTGDLGAGDDVLVRLHSECLTGDVLGSLRCDCGPQLDASLAAVGKEGRGVVVYLRGHEGRGIGLLPKLRAYQLQDSGQDTVDANLAQGLPADARDYGVGARILTDLGVRGLRLLSNNPAKLAGLERYGLAVVGRVALPPVANPENLRYLRTKRDRMGHDLDLPAIGEPRLPEVLA